MNPDQANPDRTIGARAPGKVMLAGEYAVLTGAPAILMALGRGAGVRLRRAAGWPGTVRAPVLGLEALAFRITAGGVEFDDRAGSARLGVTGRVLGELVAQLASEGFTPAPFDLAIDTSELYREDSAGRPVKLGLGSSAAVAAALYTALLADLDHPLAGAPAESRLAGLLPAYRRAQAGLASGADVAASLFGGLIEFINDGKQVTVSRVFDGDNPSGAVNFLEASLRLVWSGRPAESTDFVGCFQRWREDHPKPAAVLMQAFAAAARDALGSIREADPDRLAGAVEDYANGLLRLEQSMGAEIYTPAHREIAQIAAGCGVCYKTCGAGGGDLGMAVAREPDRLAGFERQVAAAGHVPLDWKPAFSGASCVDMPG